MSSVLLMDWKQEPVSPPCYDEASWYPEDSFYQTALKLETELNAAKVKQDPLSQALEGIENFVDIDELIKDEPFLLDEKILPLLDEVDPPRPTAVPVLSVKIEGKRQHDTEYLLKEFENVYDVVEFKYGALTPPQSPPSQKPVLTTLEPLLAQPTTYTILPEKQPLYPVPEKQTMPNVISYRPAVANVTPDEFPVVNTPQPDIAHELAVVDELVRTRVENMQWSSGSSGRSSPCSSRSSFGDYSDDPEWMPEPIETDIGSATPKKTSRKRSKPYSRTSPEDKKSRKKEQNKNAATRYRLKKKAEVEVILSEEKILMNRGEELNGKVADIQREIKCLKGLMRDLFKAKGLIN